MLSSCTSTVAFSFGGLWVYFLGSMVFLGAYTGGVSTFSSSFGFSYNSSSATEFAAKAYSTAASFASKSAYFAISASLSDYSFFAALTFLAYSNFLVFLSWTA